MHCKLHCNFKAEIIKISIVHKARNVESESNVWCLGRRLLLALKLVTRLYIRYSMICLRTSDVYLYFRVDFVSLRLGMETIVI